MAMIRKSRDWKGRVKCQVVSNKLEDSLAGKQH